MIRIATGILTLFILFTSCKGPAETVTLPDSEDDEMKRTEIAFLFVEANKHKILGNLDESIRDFQRVLKLDENNHAAMYELGGLLDYAGETNAATVLAEKSVDLDKENVWYRRQLAGFYGKSGRYSDASKQYAKLADQEPDNLDNFIDWAAALQLDNKFTDAIDVYNTVEKTSGKDFRLSMEKHRLYMGMGKREQAIAELESYIAEYPDDIRALGILAESYQKIGEYDKAMALYERVIQIDPDDPIVHLSLADYYENKGDRMRSQDELKIAFASTKLEEETKGQILINYYQATDKDKTELPFAYELADIFVKTNPESALPFSLYGDFLKRDQKWTLARNQFAKAAELGPDKFGVWTQLMLLNQQINDFPALLKSSNEAMELFPAQPSPYLFNGIAKVKSKDYDGAVESLEGGVALVIDNQPLVAQFYSTLGDAYHELKNHEKSDEAYDQTLSIDPKNAFVLNNYSYYLSERKVHLEKAAAMAKKANEIRPGTASFQDTYGWILYQQGKISDAKVWIKKAMDNGGTTDGVILEHYGDILFKEGNKTEALDYWKRAKAAGGATDLIDKKIADQQLYE